MKKREKTKITVSVSRYTTTTWVYMIETYLIKGVIAALKLLHIGP